MGTSILIAISRWAVKNFAIGESLKEVGTEVLQKCLWKPLKNKITQYFDSDNEAQQFIEQLSTAEARNEKKPERDVEDLYEEIKGEASCEGLFKSIAEFFKQNQELIKQINANYSGGNNSTIYYQRANNIYNSNGIQNIYPKDN